MVSRTLHGTPTKKLAQNLVPQISLVWLPVLYTAQRQDDQRRPIAENSSVHIAE